MQMKFVSYLYPQQFHPICMNNNTTYTNNYNKTQNIVSKLTLNKHLKHNLKANTKYFCIIHTTRRYSDGGEQHLIAE